MRCDLFDFHDGNFNTDGWKMWAGFGRERAEEL